MPVTLGTVHDVFSYHAPEDDQLARYQKIRMATEQLAIVILQETPVCGDQQSALRHVSAAMMESNAAIARKGAV